MSFHRQSKKQDLNERCADVKNKLSVEDVAEALDLVSDGPHADCPACKGVACLISCHGGRGYYCETCKETGDIIDLVCLVRNVGPPLAVAKLEEMISAKRDAKTGDLFGSLSKTSRAVPRASRSGPSGRPVGLAGSAGAAEPGQRETIDAAPSGGGLNKKPEAGA